MIRLSIEFALPLDKRFRFSCGDTTSLAAIDEAHHRSHGHTVDHNGNQNNQGDCTPNHINFFERLLPKCICQIVDGSYATDPKNTDRGTLRWRTCRTCQADPACERAHDNNC
jgi:hypothetical protein